MRVPVWPPEPALAVASGDAEVTGVAVLTVLVHAPTARRMIAVAVARMAGRGVWRVRGPDRAWCPDMVVPLLRTWGRISVAWFPGSRLGRPIWTGPPESGPNITMIANSPTVVAAAFSSSSSPVSPGERRWAAMPEPISTAARNALPSSSASSLRHSATEFMTRPARC